MKMADTSSMTDDAVIALFYEECNGKHSPGVLYTGYERDKILLALLLEIRKKLEKA